ncbi:hypothetical protein [Heliophilum fasciatum]|uniref:Uncharacterized protein n=1 Tax=Heliophilum fasciatum TaxID=35700 RepID=A0A4R2RDX6_9FIRM|nr:hypothetical protein [Heliophilum fasciatum]MCW2279320.1 hypothetical protein [Heliophilum fasciatum]TCP60419.1 hypothetical protein EDD73_1381 [Heliophilum fasciatum]
MEQKRHYADFFYVPQDYKANMTRENINETPETWLQFYPHAKYVDFLQTLLGVINGGSKSVWLTGNYGTGKSFAALVTQKLFMDDEARVRRWFADCKNALVDGETLQNDLLARRREGTLVVFDYNAQGLGPDADLLVRLEQGVIGALNEINMIIPAKANLDEIIVRLREEGVNFFKTRDEIQDRLAYLNAGIKTTEQLIDELEKPHNPTDAPVDLLGDVQKVFHARSIYLGVTVDRFSTWINEVLKSNNLRRIVYIFDEFSGFIETNKEHLKTFEEVSGSENAVGKFYLVPVTHMSIKAYESWAAANAKKSGDRFHFRNLQMPNDTAFQLAAHAMKGIPQTSDEWKTERDKLWSAVSSIADTNFDANDVSRKSFYNILPIHPMAAFLLKFLAESAHSNQRSIFEYLKGNADGREFQDFIRIGGPGIKSKQFLTVDYLWKYFIEREDLGLNKEIISIRSEFERIKGREFQNREEDDEDIRVLKTVLLFCLLSRLNPEGHERLKPTVRNIELSFQGDGAIVNVSGIIKSLADKHCFSVVNGNIELFATYVGGAEVQKKVSELEGKFHELLSGKVQEEIKKHIKSLTSSFSAGRFDIRVSDLSHTTLTNINAATRDRYSMGLNKDNGAVCLWFVVAKNREEQLQIPEKIKALLNNLRDHRILMFALPNLSFCDSNAELWNEYVLQYAQYMLENDSAAKTQRQKAYEKLEREWFDEIKKSTQVLKVYSTVNGQVESVQEPNGTKYGIR